jgi:predicted Rossmann fold nucleotide-binding protein DprA/Smf involved in DNA uptake
LDLANTAADRALTRGAVVTDEPFRMLWERGILRSSLVTHHRLVALTLATHADYTTGDMPDDQTTLFDGLVTATQLAPGQVAVALTALLERGWVRRPPGSRRRRYEDSHFRLAIPALLLDSLRRPS